MIFIHIANKNISCNYYLNMIKYLYRQDKNLSMYHLTQITSVHGHHIKGIEDSTRQPTIESLGRLAVALSSSLAEIFNDDTECSYRPKRKDG